MSKRSERIARAKARPAEETAALRDKERSAVPLSRAARFISGSARGKLLADVMEEQEAFKRAQKERYAQAEGKKEIVEVTSDEQDSVR